MQSSDSTAAGRTVADWRSNWGRFRIVDVGRRVGRLASSSVSSWGICAASKIDGGREPDLKLFELIGLD